MNKDENIKSTLENNIETKMSLFQFILGYILFLIRLSRP